MYIGCDKDDERNKMENNQGILLRIPSLKRRHLNPVIVPGQELKPWLDSK